ncbi:hypothetical protein A2U01_0094303, partial [Trifolium medium]|nr:hypothetical protein [Trifolium medium]
VKKYASMNSIHGEGDTHVISELVFRILSKFGNLRSKFSVSEVAVRIQPPFGTSFLFLTAETLEMG